MFTFLTVLMSLSLQFQSGKSFAQVSAQPGDLELNQMHLIDRADGNGPRWMPLREAMGYSAKAHSAGRCAGFMDLTHAKPILESLPLSVETFKLGLWDRPMTQGNYLSSALPLIDMGRVKSTVEALASNRNRYYRSSYGVTAAKWILAQFKEIARNRTDVSASLYAHSWEQPSVIVTIAGQGPRKNETVVIGGTRTRSTKGLLGLVKWWLREPMTMRRALQRSLRFFESSFKADSNPIARSHSWPTRVKKWGSWAVRTLRMIIVIRKNRSSLRCSWI